MSMNYDTAAEAFAHLVQALETASRAKTLPPYKEAIGDVMEALDDLGGHLADVFNEAVTVDNEGMPVVLGTTLDPATGRFVIEVEL